MQYQLVLNVIFTRFLRGKLAEKKLKDRIILLWKISIGIICKTIFVCKERLCLFIEEDESYIKHILKLSLLRYFLHFSFKLILLP